MNLKWYWWFLCARIRSGRLVPALALMLLGFFIPAMAGAQYQLQYDLFSASFPTEQEGWVCGRRGTILHTADGGASWVRQKCGVTYTLSSICFVDGENGWVVGDGGTIIHTGDGGKTWVNQESPVPTFHMGVCFVNSQTGWIVTEKTTILYTANGGKSWQVQFQDQSQDLVLRSISFCDERTGWVAGESGFIYHTTDGGKSWVKQAGENYISDETWLLVTGNYLFSLYAVNPSTAWVAGIDGYVARTTDGGSSWQQVKSGIPKTHLFAIAADGKQTVHIGGNALVLSSSDEGESFAPAMVEPPVTYGWIGNIVRRGAPGFVAVGRQGWIYLTEGTGTTWKRVKY